MDRIPCYQTHIATLAYQQELDVVARVIEKLTNDGSFRRLSNEAELEAWICIAWKQLEKRLHRGQKRWWCPTEWDEKFSTFV